MKKIFEKFFKGYAVLEEVESPINGRIQVLEDIFGKKRLVVGGLTQSGEAVEKIWREAISNFQFPISNCLILGLGAGSAGWVVNKFFPGVKILGIEIDPEIIRLGEKYFVLGEIKNLKIIKIANAINWVNCSHDSNHSNKFDLMLIDLYIGVDFPEEAENEEFLENLKKLLSKNGVLIFNRLYYGGKKEKTDQFGEKLKKFFSQIEAKKVSKNKLFLGRNQDAN